MKWLVYLVDGSVRECRTIDEVVQVVYNETSSREFAMRMAKLLPEKAVDWEGNFSEVGISIWRKK